MEGMQHLTSSWMDVTITIPWIVKGWSFRYLVFIWHITEANNNYKDLFKTLAYIYIKQCKWKHLWFKESQRKIRKIVTSLFTFFTSPSAKYLQWTLYNSLSNNVLMWHL